MAKCKDWGAAHDHAHGTTSGWSYHGCRCNECEEAHYVAHREYDRRRSASLHRQSYQRQFFRQKRREGNPAYANHGSNDSHRRAGWAAGRRYREQNRDVVNARARARTARLGENVGAERKWWTPSDDQVVQRDDITLVEVAYLLGRTPSACAQRRWRLANGQRSTFAYRSDIECRYGHSRVNHGYRTPTQWRCRECQRQGAARHKARKSIKEQAA